jgi:hypothetical protein
MWTIPPLSDLESTLRDPASPIGKRMRAAYYLKQLHTDLLRRREEKDSSRPLVVLMTARTAHP